MSRFFFYLIKMKLEWVVFVNEVKIGMVLPSNLNEYIFSGSIRILLTNFTKVSPNVMLGHLFE